MRVLVASVLLLACKGKEPAATPEACDAAVARVAIDDDLRPALAGACVATKWSAALRDCAKQATDLETCKDKMDVDQRSAYAQIKVVAEKARAQREAQQKAEAAAAAAQKEVQEAQEVMTRLGQDAEALTKKLDDVVAALAAAKTQAERDAAKAKLDELQREQAELEVRIAEARAKAARAERMKGVSITKECLENPLAKGCD